MDRAHGASLAGLDTGAAFRVPERIAECEAIGGQAFSPADRANTARCGQTRGREPSGTDQGDLRRCQAQRRLPLHRRQRTGEFADMRVSRASHRLRSRIHARASTPMYARGPNRAGSDAGGFAVTAGCRGRRGATPHGGHLAVDRRASARGRVCGARGRPVRGDGRGGRTRGASDGAEPVVELASIASWMSRATP